MEFQVAKLGTAEGGARRGSSAGRPSWPEGAGGSAESQKSPIPAWKGGLGCRASLGDKVVTSLPCFLDGYQNGS